MFAFIKLYEFYFFFFFFFFFFLIKQYANPSHIGRFSLYIISQKKKKKKKNMRKLK